MNVFPMNRDEAKKKHWVVRWLRNIGYLICIASTIGGAVGALQYAGAVLPPVDGSYAFLIAALTLIFGGLIGLTVGLGISLPYWAISLALDDLHTMRQYMQGFVILGDKQDIN